MKKIILLLFALSNFAVFSQEDAWIYFNSKPDAQTYFDNPLTMLTQRSLDRRTLQNIPLDIKDVPIYQPYIDQIAASSGISVMAKSKWFNAIHVQGTQLDIEALKTLSFVDHVDFANRTLNVAGRIAAPKRIAKVNKTFETQTVFNYGNSANQIKMLKGDLLHQQNYTGLGKVIAVMDGGFPGVNTASTFSRLRNNNQILGGYDYVNRSSNFYTGIDHGTMVLSTMGGFKDNQLVGTAPDASYYLFITEDGNKEGPLELSLWVEAAEEADRVGADVITTSLGYTQFDNSNYDFTYDDMNGVTAFISKGVDVAFSRGIVCVVSAGNEGANNWHYISAPADAVHALAIGAVNSSGNYASFSSQGPSFDGRVKPDVVAQGQQSVLSDTAGNIVTASGTSFSGPIIAGMVASFWQALPNKTNAEIVELIKESASIYSNPNDQLGYGIPNFYLALNNALSVKSSSNADFVVYPNPTQGEVSISLPYELINANITFYTVLGQKVFNQEITEQNTTIQLNNINSGMYLYKITANNYSQTGKIIKQ
jgi:hypothetical protein